MLTHARCLCSGREVDEAGFKAHYCVLLQRFLDHNGDLELQALYALQQLIEDIQHPQGERVYTYCTYVQPGRARDVIGVHVDVVMHTNLPVISGDMKWQTHRKL